MTWFISKPTSAEDSGAPPCPPPATSKTPWMLNDPTATPSATKGAVKRRLLRGHCRPRLVSSS